MDSSISYQSNSNGHNSPTVPKPTLANSITNRKISKIMFNCQSNISKVVELGVTIVTLNPDIFVGTETWFSHWFPQANCFPRDT